MNKSRDERIFDDFNDMLHAIVSASNFVCEITQAEFALDTKVRYAVTRCMEIVSNRARHVGSLGRISQFDHLPWREMIGLYRKINHAYQELDPDVLWKTIKKDFKELEIFIRSVLGENLRDDIPQHKKGIPRIKLISTYELELTSGTLTRHVTPYLQAISELQNLIDTLKGNPIKYVSIKTISQNSPIDVKVDDAAKAIEVIRDIIVPWRRENARRMAELRLRESTLKIENAKADLESKKMEMESSLQKKEIEQERARLENEKLRLEIQEKKIELAMMVLNSVSPELSQKQKLLYTMQLMEPLGVLIESPFLLEPVTIEQDETKSA